MRRKRTPEEVKRLKAKGIFDVGVTYERLNGFGRLPRYERWDKDEDDAHRDG